MDRLRRDFARQGFAVLPPLSRADLLAEARAAVERIQATAGRLPPGPARERLVFERDLSARQREGRPAEAAGEALFIIGDPPAFDPVFARLAIQPEIVAAVRALLGCADIRLHLSNVTTKQAGLGSRVAWHRDYPNRYICPAGPSFPRALLCLDGMDAANGGVAVLPGSQERVGEAPAPADLAAAVTVHRAPGATLLIHPTVLHGSARNRSAGPRCNLVVQRGRADDPPRLAEGEGESPTGRSVAEIEDWLAKIDAR